MPDHLWFKFTFDDLREGFEAANQIKDKDLKSKILTKHLSSIKGGVGVVVVTKPVKQLESIATEVELDPEDSFEPVETHKSLIVSING